MKTNTRDSLILALALLLVLAAFIVDVFFFPEAILPGPPFFLSILIAAYFLAPRTTVVVAGVATTLKLTADLIQETPLWLTTLYFVALVLVGFAGTALAQRIRRETDLSQTLRASEERLKRSQEIAHLGSWELDLVHNRLIWSDEVYRIFGLQPQEFGATYEAFLDRVHPEDRAAVDAAYSDSLRENRDSYEIEHRVVRKSTGEIRIVHEKCEHFRDAGGRIIRSVGMVHDITERKRAEEERDRLLSEVQRRAAELNAANKELEAFSYSVSHDLRAPLRHIDGFSKILLKAYADKLDERGKQYLQFLCDGSQKMDQLIDAMLKLSRATRAEMRRQPVNLSELAESILVELHKEDPDRQVELNIAPGVIANGDPSLLRNVLENLLGNAWKFTSKCPVARIELGVARQDGKPVYYVRDNGAGFDMAYADKLFGAFQRLHKAEDYPGTGIGLATVQRIVRRHGGQVWAEAEVDKGATFYFTLG